MRIMDLTCWTNQTVTLDKAPSQAERRCTIAHEVEHLRRGPVGRACAREG